MKDCARGTVVAAIILCGGVAVAQDVGRVISSTAVVQQVAVPRQVCNAEPVAVAPQRSGAGAALGAVAGGAVGNAVGHGSGRAVATMIGIFGGAVLGDQIEGQGATAYQNVQRCMSQTVFENRVAHYVVVYEYAGKQYTTQMPYDPGPAVKLQIAPVDMAPPVPPGAPLTYTQPAASQIVYSAPAYVAVAPPPVPGYYIYPYSPPIGLNLQFGYRGGFHRHHDYWR